VRRWDVKTGQLLRTVTLPAEGTLTPDRRTAATFAWPGLRFWNADSNQPTGFLLLLDHDQWLACTPTGQFRTSASLAKEMMVVVQTEAGQEMLTAEDFKRRFSLPGSDPGVRVSTAPR
jgi:hypothetical protein